MENHLKTGGEPIEFQRVTVPDTITPACLDAFQQMKLRRKHRFIIYKIGAEEMEVELIGDRNETYDNMKKSLPFAECRFCIWDQDIKTADGRNTSKLWFVSWFPDNANTHMKMAYASAKGKFRDHILGVFDTQVASLEELDANLGLAKDDEEDDKDFDF